MLNGNLTKDALVPLVLRLALAAIFIYHGLAKIGGAPNDWGSMWATVQWQKQAEPPPGLMAKLDEMEKASEAPEQIQVVRERLRVLYARDTPLVPEALNFHVAQIAVAWGELLGGIALLLGLLTRLAALGLVIIQLGAIVTVTGAQGFSSLGGIGFDFNLALVAMCVVLILTGGGSLAVDRCLRRRKPAAAAEPPAAPAPAAPAPV